MKYANLGGRQNAFDIIPGFRDIMEACGIKLSQEANLMDVELMVDKLSGYSAFEKNVPRIAKALRLEGDSAPSNDLLDLIQATEVLDKWDMRSVERRQAVPVGETATLILHSGTLSLIRRRVAQAVMLDRYGRFHIGDIFALGSDRICGLGTEVMDPLYQEARDNHRELTEINALVAIAKKAGFPDVQKITGPHVRDTVPQLRTVMKHLGASQIVFPTTGNALHLVLNFRRHCRSRLWREFDEGGSQFRFCSDAFELARDPEQAANPTRFQRPMPLISALVLLMRELYYLNGGTPRPTAA